MGCLKALIAASAQLVYNSRHHMQSHLRCKLAQARNSGRFSIRPEGTRFSVLVGLL
jgi:hypothetical protein